MWPFEHNCKCMYMYVYVGSSMQAFYTPYCKVTSAGYGYVGNIYAVNELSLISLKMHQIQLHWWQFPVCHFSQTNKEQREMSLWATVSTSLQSKSYLLNPIADPPLHSLTWKRNSLCSNDTSPFSVLFPYIKVKITNKVPVNPTINPSNII